MKRLCFVVLFTALVASASHPAAAQDIASTVTIREAGLMPVSPLDKVVSRSGHNSPPSFCKPCLWYAGDFNSNNSDANGAANEKDLLIRASAVYVPFTVPKGKIWNVTGVFGIVFDTDTVIDPKQADWSFSKGVSAGHAGKVIKSGTTPATFTGFYHCGQEVQCWQVEVKGIKVTLKAGRYWLSVVPYCTNKNDSNCSSTRYFLMDVEDNPPLEHYGPKNVLDASYITSKQHGLYFAPTWGGGGPCGGNGCDMFSAGLLGTAKVDNGAPDH